MRYLEKQTTLEAMTMTNSKSKATLDIKGEQIERELATSILEQYTIKTIRLTDQIYIYKKGIFVKDVKNTFTREWIDYYAEQHTIEQYNNKTENITVKPYRITIQSRNNILEFIKVKTFSNFDDFDSNPKIINLLNGLYSLEGFEVIIPNPKREDGSYHGPEDPKLLKGKVNFISHEKYKDIHGEYYKSFIQFPVNYDEEAECLKIDQVLSDIFGFNTVPLIYQMIAYFFMPSVKYGKAFMLYGETGTGKTTFLNIISQIVDSKNISGLSLLELQKRFQKTILRYSIVNIYDDLPNAPLTYNNIFRQVVTNSRLTGEIKGIQDHVSWNNRTKLVYSCNELPPLKNDGDDAFFKRWVLIRCQNAFRDLETFSEDYRDKQWDNKELSGLLNKILQAYKTLEANRGFPKKWNDIDYVRSIWNIDQNPVALFIKEKCEVGESYYQIEKQLFLNELNAFRKKHNGKPIRMNYCTRKLRHLDNRIDTIKIIPTSKYYTENRLSTYDYNFIQLKEDHEYLTSGPEIFQENPIIDDYIKK